MKNYTYVKSTDLDRRGREFREGEIWRPTCIPYYSGIYFRGIAPSSSKGIFSRFLISVPLIDLGLNSQLTFLQLVTTPMVYIFTELNQPTRLYM